MKTLDEINRLMAATEAELNENRPVQEWTGRFHFNLLMLERRV